MYTPQLYIPYPLTKVHTMYIKDALFVQISQQKNQIQAYIRTQKRTRIYTEEDLHGIKWPIDRSTNTAADTATASAEATTDAPDALVNAPKLPPPTPLPSRCCSAAVPSS